MHDKYRCILTSASLIRGFVELYVEGVVTSCCAPATTPVELYRNVMIITVN